MAEDCVRAATENHPHMRSIILRPRAIFGEHDQVLIPRLQRMLHQYDGHLLLPRAGKTLLDLTYAGNVAHAMWLATVHPTLPSGMAFNITNHQSVVLRDVLTRLFVEELKQSMRIVNLNYRLLDMVARCLELVSALSGREPVMTRYSVGAVYYDMTLDNRLAQQVLGYRPMVSMNEGLQRTAQWLKGLTHG